MGEMLLELEQYIANVQYLIDNIISDNGELQALLDESITKLIYLSNDSISYRWIIEYNNIKTTIEEALYEIERGTYYDFY